MPDYQDPSYPSAASAVLAAADALAMRALERANNRLGRRSGEPKRCPEAELEAALRGAWVHVPQTAAILQVNASILRNRLDQYARTQLRAGCGHDTATLKAILLP